MSTTEPNYDYTDDYTHVPPCNRDAVNIAGAHMSVIFYFMFFLSLFGNGLVLVIIHRFEKMTTVTNILLLNLVVSSLIFMSSLPFIAIYMQLSRWIFGSVMCKICGAFYYLGLYSSVLFLTLITFDRHLAVVYSLGASRLRNRMYAVISCTVVWLVSILACIRHIILHNTFIYHLENRTLCAEYRQGLSSFQFEQIRNAGFYIQIFVFLLFPLIVVIYCYAKIAITVITSKIASKFKTVRLIFVIVLLFFVCWTPFNIVLLLKESESSCEEAQKLDYALHVTRNLAYIYFCISPIFYTFVGRKFQNYFRQMLVSRFPGLKKHVSVSRNTVTKMSTKTTTNDL